MSLIPNRWREGHAPGYYEIIPEEERCEYCNGKGEGMNKHQFGIGYSYIPCNKCHGSGRKEK